MNADFARIPADIERATLDIKDALRSGDMGRALLLVSKKIGLRICAGDIAVKLKPARWK